MEKNPKEKIPLLPRTPCRKAVATAFFRKLSFCRSDFDLINRSIAECGSLTFVANEDGLRTAAEWPHSAERQTKPRQSQKRESFAPNPLSVSLELNGSAFAYFVNFCSKVLRKVTEVATVLIRILRPCRGSPVLPFT